MNWRNELDPMIKDHVEVRVKQSSENKEALLKSKYPRESQLWASIGYLSKELSETKIKLKYLEKALEETLKTKKKKTKSKKEQKEIDDIMKTLSRL